MVSRLPTGRGHTPQATGARTSGEEGHGRAKQVKCCLRWGLRDEPRTNDDGEKTQVACYLAAVGGVVAGGAAAKASSPSVGGLGCSAGSGGWP